MKILVAGVGNIFFGDDAFGCEVASALTRRVWARGVRIEDFGIRSYDLAYAMMDADATIIVDAAPRGSAPGTLYVIEPNLTELDSPSDEAVNAHAMNPVRVLRLVGSLGGSLGRVLVVGCEPETLESQGQLGLSAKVRAAIPVAVETIEKLVADLLSDEAAESSTKGTTA